jgi:hypothetical protein
MTLSGVILPASYKKEEKNKGQFEAEATCRILKLKGSLRAIKRMNFKFYDYKHDGWLKLI